MKTYVFKNYAACVCVSMRALKTYPQKKMGERGSAYSTIRGRTSSAKKARRNGKAGEEELFLTPKEKYQAINETIRLYQLKNRTRHLCQVANVSPSGYYKWLQNREKHYMNYLLR